MIVYTQPVENAVDTTVLPVDLFGTTGTGPVGGCHVSTGVDNPTHILGGRTAGGSAASRPVIHTVHRPDYSDETRQISIDYPPQAYGLHVDGEHRTRLSQPHGTMDLVPQVAVSQLLPTTNAETTRRTVQR